MGNDAGRSSGGVGLASIAARENLIDLAGGLDKLSSKTQAYYGSFYQSDEQLQRAAEQAQKTDSGFADWATGAGQQTGIPRAGRIAGFEHRGRAQAV